MKPKFIILAALMLSSISATAQGTRGRISGIVVDKAGVFSYDPKTETVQQTISLSGNLNYIHFFE